MATVKQGQLVALLFCFWSLTLALCHRPCCASPAMSSCPPASVCPHPHLAQPLNSLRHVVFQQNLLGAYMFLFETDI